MRPIALAALLPLAAFAQTSTPAPTSTPPAAQDSREAAPAAPADAPRWSFGAGVFSGSTILLNTSSLYLGLPEAPSGVAASLERRLSDRTWLVLGLSGAITRADQDIPPGYSGTTRDDANQLSIGGGARYVLTPARAPVDFSAVALVEGGVVDGTVERREYVSGVGGPEAVTYDTTGWRAGASFGVAVDRVLTGALSLRVATPLLATSYTSTRTRVSGQATLDGSAFVASVVIAPRLELRLAF